MPIIPFKGNHPDIHPTAFVAPDAWITGDVHVGEHASILFGAALRGDIQGIRIGARTNLQEQVIVHTSHGLPDAVVGEDVTVGHRAIVHGATIQDRCIIGMGSVILDGATIGEDCIIGAQSLVSMHKKIPPRSLVLGVPGRVIRELTDEELQEIKRSAAHYIEVCQTYRETLAPPAR